MPPRTPHSALRNSVGVGIVGLGFMAATHLKAYRQIEGYRIAALCNPSGRNLDGDFSEVAGNVALYIFDSIFCQPTSRVVAQSTVWDDI